MGGATGGGAVTVLTNGNYVVASEFWDNGTAVDAGAVTWGNGTTGISGAVSSTNSLVGTQAGDRVGGNMGGGPEPGGGSTVTALTNGNYVVASANWANGTATNAGAVTWGNGTTGSCGAVSSTNSLVGTQANDRVGGNMGGGRTVTALTNDNYVVASANWANGTATNAGAVTWGNGTTGSCGAVSSTNSLVGSHANDYIGNYGINVLNSGNYIVRSGNWDNGSATDAGAVTWGSGTTGVSGEVSAANSLVGTTAGDNVGNNSLTLLSNGNYVVSSVYWNNGTAANAGAVTWGSGTSGVSGVVSSANSLVGTHADDCVGSIFRWGWPQPAVTALANGNYVVTSSNWANGSMTCAGAVTWGSGTSGVSGSVSSKNSLVGTHIDDKVGTITNYWGDLESGLTMLANGNYLLRSSAWDNGSATDAGAVTWGSGTSGVSGSVSSNNSLVGTHPGDNLGSSGITVLTNSNYVVCSAGWANGTVTNAGAVTWGSGTTGISGEVFDANSLVGTRLGDGVGNNGVNILANGNYVVRSLSWDNGTAAEAGAITWGSGNSGVSGEISAANSLTGTTAYQRLGQYFYDDTVNNRLVVSDNNNKTVLAYSNIPGGTAAPLNLLDSFAMLAPDSLTTSPGTITASLNAGTDVFLKANNDIAINLTIASTNSTAGALRLFAGRSIYINADITANIINLTANDTPADGVLPDFRNAGKGSIAMAAGTTLSATSGIFLNISNGFTSGSMALANISTGSLSLFLSTDTGVGSISQRSGSTITASTTTINATAGNITLTGAGNDFGTELSATGSNVAIAAGTMLNLKGITGTGTVMINYTGNDPAGGITIANGFKVVSNKPLATGTAATMLLNAGNGVFNNLSTDDSVQANRWRIYAADETKIIGTALAAASKPYYSGPVFRQTGWNDIAR
jgi:hypothetical protein